MSSRWTVGTRGTSLPYLERPGSGPTIVLIHGAGHNAALWMSLAEHLRGYRLLAFDLPGHGASTAFREWSWEVSQVVLTQAVRDTAPSPILVGHSIGGVLATLVAQATGATCVVNVDGWSGLGLPSLHSQQAENEQIQTVTEHYNSLTGPFSELLQQLVDDAVQSGFDEGRISPMIRRSLETENGVAVHRPTGTFLSSLYESMRRFELVLRTPLSTPYLFVAARKGIPPADLISETEWQAARHHILDGLAAQVTAREVVWLDCDHHIPLKAPESLAKELIGFLGSHAGN